MGKFSFVRCRRWARFNEAMVKIFEGRRDASTWGGIRNRAIVYKGRLGFVYSLFFFSFFLSLMRLPTR